MLIASHVVCWSMMVCSRWNLSFMTTQVGAYANYRYWSSHLHLSWWRCLGTNTILLFDICYISCYACDYTMMVYCSIAHTISYLPLMGTGCSLLVNLVKWQTQHSQMLHEITPCPRCYLGYHYSGFVIRPSVTITPVFGGKCDLENLVRSIHNLLTVYENSFNNNDFATIFSFVLVNRLS